MEIGGHGVLGMSVLLLVEVEVKRAQDNAMIHQFCMVDKNAREKMKKLKIAMNKIAQVRI